jgi:hypothetical protein
VKGKRKKEKGKRIKALGARRMAQGGRKKEKGFRHKAHGARWKDKGFLKWESFEVGSRTRRRPWKTGLCRGKHAEVGKMENGFLKWEVGPVVVPGKRDYAAASMRKSEKEKDD